MLTKKTKFLICLFVVLIMSPILINCLDALALETQCEGDWSCPYEKVWVQYTCMQEECTDSPTSGTCRKCEDP